MLTYFILVSSSNYVGVLEVHELWNFRTLEKMKKKIYHCISRELCDSFYSIFEMTRILLT